MTWTGLASPRRTGLALVVALVATAAVVAVPTPAGLDRAGQLALATMVLAAILWVTDALPLAVTALLIPVALTVFGVYDDMELALSGFADPLIFLFIAGFMLAEALQTHNIDRRIALGLIDWMGRSPRLLILAIMLATAFLSMWVSNTATTTILAPILVGLGSVLATTLGVDPVQAAVFLTVTGAVAASFAFALPVATPPNAIVFGSGHLQQRHMIRAGVVLNALMTLVLTLLLVVLFVTLWPYVLW
jgi:sodium-dependent dicarboxylate transporter 2/3/5